MIDFFTKTPLFGILLTLATFEIGKIIKNRFKMALLNPFLISTCLTILILKCFQIPFENYDLGRKYGIFLLTPATIALSVSLYKEIDLLKKYLAPILIGGLIGSFVAAFSVIILGKVLGIDKSLILSFIPKSTTVPIGIELSSIINGIPSLTIFSIVITGITGYIGAPFICKIFKIKHPVAKGLGIGISSHVIGTTKAMEMGKSEGAMSSLAIVIAGIFTFLWLPVFLMFL